MRLGNSSSFRVTDTELRLMEKIRKNCSTHPMQMITEARASDRDLCFRLHKIVYNIYITGILYNLKSINDRTTSKTKSHRKSDSELRRKIKIQDS